MLWETRDPAAMERFAAHPDIAPFVGGPLDFKDAIRETTVFLFGQHGGFIYEWCAPGTYEGHVMLTREGRGAWGFNAVRQSVAMMADRGAEHLWARTTDRHIAMFARRGGFREVGRMTLHRPEPREYLILEWRRPCLLQSLAA